MVPSQCERRIDCGGVRERPDAGGPALRTERGTERMVVGVYARTVMLRFQHRMLTQRITVQKRHRDRQAAEDG
ncbi:MAG: hypothetical protein HY701_07390 [Gemmatimonadetes bacterium]|nr:hypothetical protein [Gemmatimonadota bacterium]